MWSVRVAQHDAKYCSVIQSTFTALEHLDIYVSYSRTTKPHMAAYSHMNLDAIFSIGYALEHRFNQLTLTVMTEERQDLERLAFPGIISSNDNTFDDIPELEGGGFVIDGVTSTKLTHLDLADMRLSLEVICRLNRYFPNLERLTVGGRNLTEPLSDQQNTDFVATPLSVKSFALHFGTVDDLLVLLPLMVLDLAGSESRDGIDSKQFTFTELKHGIMKQMEMIARLRAKCLQDLECLTLKCHSAWAFLNFAPGNVSPHPSISLSTLELGVIKTKLQ
ncbi:hypothetical protein KI688_005031 [Linnemannia hyalina]|uniref:Uncharacterized protein n=1 Tax=Linnemannia hyalina TaxID=64524 RepID=A0A9P8BNX5_9FUNG|nr:hypothetical protein KI688_005031 [Linnemannia hyalina]